MTKYGLIPLKSHKARIDHVCFSCNKEINVGKVVYYRSDKFLQTLSNKKFCEECFNKYGQELIKLKIKKSKLDKYQTTFS